MRRPVLALAAGLLVVGAAPALAGPGDRTGPAAVSYQAATARSLPQVTSPTAAPTVAPTVAPALPPVVDVAPDATSVEGSSQFAYPAVFLVPIALLAGAAWAARAFTRDLTRSPG